MNQANYYPEVSREEIETGQYYYAIEVQAKQLLAKLETEMIVIAKNADIFECALSLRPSLKEYKVAKGSTLSRYACDLVKGFSIGLSKPLNEIV